MGSRLSRRFLKRPAALILTSGDALCQPPNTMVSMSPFTDARPCLCPAPARSRARSEASEQAQSPPLPDGFTQNARNEPDPGMLYASGRAAGWRGPRAGAQVRALVTKSSNQPGGRSAGTARGSRRSIRYKRNSIRGLISLRARALMGSGNPQPPCPRSSGIFTRMEAVAWRLAGQGPVLWGTCLRAPRSSGSPTGSRRVAPDQGFQAMLAQAGSVNRRRPLRSECPCGQQYSLACAFHPNSRLDSVPCLRSLVSYAGTCGAMSMPLKIQPSIGAVPWAVSPTRRLGLGPNRAWTRSIVVPVESTSCLRSADVDNHAEVQVDKVVGRVGEERWIARCRGSQSRGGSCLA